MVTAPPLLYTPKGRRVFGIPPETRTPTKGFGDPRAAITPARYILNTLLGMCVLKHTRLPLQPCSCQFRMKLDEPSGSPWLCVSVNSD